MNCTRNCTRNEQVVLCTCVSWQVEAIGHSLLIIPETHNFPLFIHNRCLRSVKLELQLVAIKTDSKLENVYEPAAISSMSSKQLQLSQRNACEIFIFFVLVCFVYVCIAGRNLCYVSGTKHWSGHDLSGLSASTGLVYGEQTLSQSQLDRKQDCVTASRKYANMWP